MTGFETEERALLDNSVNRFVEENRGGETTGRRMQELWQRFAELGWLALPLAEASGGLGGGPRDVQVVSRAFGRGLLSTPYLESAVLAAKAIEFSSPRSPLLAELASGDLILTFAHDEAQADIGFEHVTCTVEAGKGDWLLTGVKSVVRHVDVADGLLVTARMGADPVLLNVPKVADGLVIDAFPTIDGINAGRIIFQRVAIGEEAIIAKGALAQDAVMYAQLQAICCLSAELEGIAEAARLMTGEYLNTREQFGEKLAEFQALQHIFADMVSAEEEIRAIAWMAADACQLNDGLERERILRAVKARSAELARAMLEQAVQLHGGVGVSEEFAVGRYLRRSIALDAMLGDAGQHTRWQASRYFEARS